MWDLFKQQPIALYHPFAGLVPCVAISPIKGGVAWWNANYMLAAAKSGGMIGASGFSLNPVLGAFPEWNEEKQSWIMQVETPAGKKRVYRFSLPDENMRKQWDEFKGYLTPIDELHRIAAERYGSE